MTFSAVMSFIKTVFVLSALTFALTGCALNDFRTVGVEEVLVSESGDLGSFHELDIVTFDSPEAIRVFEDMIRGADQIPGIANAFGPEYDVEVRFTDGDASRYYLWLNDPKSPSSLYEANDTHTAYRIPADVTDELIELLEADE